MWCLAKIAGNGQSLLLCWYFITGSLELQPIKDTEVENIFCCSSVFGQPDM